MRPKISTCELLKITRFCIFEGRIGWFVLAMGTVLRHRQTCWIRYHLPHSAASGDHCCKLIKMLSLAEKPSWEIKKISAIFSSFSQELRSELGHAKKLWFNQSISEEQCSIKTSSFLQVLVRLSLSLHGSNV